MNAPSSIPGLPSVRTPTPERLRPVGTPPSGRPTGVVSMTELVAQISRNVGAITKEQVDVASNELRGAMGRAARFGLSALLCSFVANGVLVAAVLAAPSLGLARRAVGLSIGVVLIALGATSMILARRPSSPASGSSPARSWRALFGARPRSE